eukprot:1159539-Pelagomonas_calceolata.AAC.6
MPEASKLSNLAFNGLDISCRPSIIKQREDGAEVMWKIKEHQAVLYGMGSWSHPKHLSVQETCYWVSQEGVHDLAPCSNAVPASNRRHSSCLHTSAQQLLPMLGTDGEGDGEEGKAKGGRQQSGEGCGCPYKLCDACVTTLIGKCDSSLAAEQEQNMAALNDVMADTKTGPKAAQGQLGYWIPGGIGNKHKLPKGANQNEAAYAPMAHTGRPSCGQGGARHHQKRQVSGAHVHQVGAVGFSEVWASVACQAASARGTCACQGTAHHMAPARLSQK